MNVERHRMSFGTKAETLERFKPLVERSTVLDLYYFTVAEWTRSEDAIIRTIRERFDGGHVAVRSSAYGEDGSARSMAGTYTTRLDVDGSDEAALRAAVQTVIGSYSGYPRDQVLVQPMLRDVALSGVTSTYDLESGAPYYVLNYDDESGKTDKITGGVGVNKTVIVHRDFRPEYIESPRVAEMLAMTQEIETICGDGERLNIEFAKTHDGIMYLLQVRRSTVPQSWNRANTARVSDAIVHVDGFLRGRSRPRPSVAGSRTILGQMPDWNPAEIIGTNPRPLAASLYRYLVTDEVWREARASMGYREVPNETLMVLVAGRPYIDVRNSFTSFLPAGLDGELEDRLVDAWLGRLAEKPELHDKVEFDIVPTVLDFTFDQTFESRYGGVLTRKQLDVYRARLAALTRVNVTVEDSGSLAGALSRVGELEGAQAARATRPTDGGSGVWDVLHLLDECRSLGTLPFSVIARHAFMAEALLRSAVARGALTAERLERFKRSLVTVAGRLTRDFESVQLGELDEPAFFERYGHLRPGTYDILSLRYDQREGLFQNGRAPEHPRAAGPFTLTRKETEAIGSLLLKSGLDHLAPDELLRYADRAIVGREHAKFVFSRHLSDAIELIAEWGKTIGITRDDLSYLTLSDIAETANVSAGNDIETYVKDLADAGRRAADSNRGIRLGYIIRDVHDIYVVPLHRSEPNFVTSRQVEGETVRLDEWTDGPIDLFNKIVCIENADPGYDWIFTRSIAGLISKFGGANSHMTIRCGELGLPAAIGVGEQTFDRLVNAGRVELNCGDKVVRPQHG